MCGKIHEVTVGLFSGFARARGRYTLDQPVWDMPGESDVFIGTAVPTAREAAMRRFRAAEAALFTPVTKDKN